MEESIDILLDTLVERSAAGQALLFTWAQGPQLEHTEKGKPPETLILISNVTEGGSDLMLYTKTKARKNATHWAEAPVNMQIDGKSSAPVDEHKDSMKIYLS